MRKIFAAALAALLLASAAYAQLPGGPGAQIPNSPGGGGSGSVTGITLIDTACGVSGGPITTTGTIQGAAVVRAVTGVTDTTLSTDCGKVVTVSNASPVTITLPQATGAFGAPFFYTQVNLGAGTATIVPTTSTINGATSLTLTTGQSGDIASDGTNYIVALGRGGSPTTNASDLTSGTLNAARLPAFTGDCTTSAGSSNTVCAKFATQTYAVNNWYNAGGDRGLVLSSSSSTGGGAIGRKNCYAAPVWGPATISTLGFRVNTTSAGGLMHGAIYANNAATGRPTGNALSSTSVAMSTTSAASVSATLSSSVAVTGYAILWFCSDQDNGTSTVNAFSNATTSIANLTGSVTQSNLLAGSASTMTGVTVPGVFGTWPDMTGAAFTEIVTGFNMPIVQFRVGSVP